MNFVWNQTSRPPWHPSPRGTSVLSHAGRGTPASTQPAQHLREQVCSAGTTFSPRKSHTHLPTLIFSQQRSGFRRNSQAICFFHCSLSLELTPTKHPSTIQNKLCTSFSKVLHSSFPARIQPGSLGELQPGYSAPHVPPSRNSAPSPSRRDSARARE